MKQPAYLSKVALKAIHRLTFRIILTQFSQSSSLFLRKKIVPRQSTSERGSIHPYAISEYVSCSPLLTTLNEMSTFDPLPKFSFLMVNPQSLMTILKAISSLISYLNRDLYEKLLPSYQKIQRTLYLLALVLSSSQVQLVTLHFFMDSTGQISAGMSANCKLNEAQFLISFADNLISISISRVPGWMTILSRQIQPPSRLKLVKDTFLLITFPSISTKASKTSTIKLTVFLFMMMLIILE